MKINKFVIIISSLFCFLAAATAGQNAALNKPQNNPQIRICQNLRGEFLSAQDNEDQVGLCKFDSAYVGTVDLLQFKDAGISAESIQVYRDGAKSCEPYGQLKMIQILNQGQHLQVCSFQDGSIMLNTTLEAGSRAVINQRLNQALGLY